jgi:RsiW-degrading membrane proteinase PrsW (M82 family)
VTHPETSHLYERWRRTHPVRKWGATALAAVVSGPFAVLAALWQNSTVGFSILIMVVVLAPVIEEVVKGAGALWLAEMRPWLVPTAIVLPVVTLMSGLVFASLENVWYLVILIEDPSDELIRWRWTLGPLLHGTASFIVGLGAARLWRSGLRSGRPDFGDALPFIVAAAVLHGGYNLVAVVLSVTGVGPDA